MAREGVRYDYRQRKYMQKILRFRIQSIVWACAVFYGLIGAYASTKSAIMHEENILCPFGFEFPMCHLSISVTLKTPTEVWLTAAVVLISIIFYAITGMISSFALSLIYNFTSGLWPGISAQVIPSCVQPEVTSAAETP